MKYFAVIFLITLLLGMAVVPSVFAQALGGKVTYYGMNPLDPTFGRHMISGIRPSFPPGVVCPICLGPLGIGRWFLGVAVGGVVTVGGLGGY